MKRTKTKFILHPKNVLYLFIGLLTIASIFYACKKSEADLSDNEKFSRELKTYHESLDYQKLKELYPNSIFKDLSIFDANDKVKAIVTEIKLNNTEIIKAMTLFEPQKSYNLWFPTIIVNIVSQTDINSMVKANNFTGVISLTNTDEEVLNKVELKNNVSISEQHYAYDLNGDLKFSAKSLGRERLMLLDTGSDLKGCLKAANACAAKAINDMGWVSYVLCCTTLPACLATAYADCLISEDECLGIPKPLL